MPRHTAPNHPDCFIDCLNGGFAIYIAPIGPCVTNCNNAALAEEIFDTINQRGWQTQSSGSVQGISRRQLGNLARRLRQGPAGGQEADDILTDLEQIGATRPDETMDTTWSNTTVVDALKRLRDAAG
jgi:hypothetical protein